MAVPISLETLSGKTRAPRRPRSLSPGDLLERSARAASPALDDPLGGEDPAQTESILRSLGRKTLSGISTVGSLLDLPGSSVRDLLTGNNPLDQWIDPFNEQKRASGRDLLTQYGITSQNKETGFDYKNPGELAQDTAGLAAEIALDPMTYLTFGLSAVGKGGRVAKAAGVLDKAQEVASKTAGKMVGPRTARMTTTLGDIIQHSPESMDAISRAAAAQGLRVRDIASQPLGGLVGFNTPFSRTPRTVAAGSKSLKAAELLDKAGAAIRDTAPVRAAYQLFGGSRRGTGTLIGQKLAEKVSKASTEVESLAAGETARALREIRDSGFLDNYNSIDDAHDHLYQMLEGIVPATPEVADSVARLQQHMPQVLSAAQSAGLKTKQLDDQFADYFGRRRIKAKGKDAKVTDRGTAKYFGVTDPAASRRADILRDLPGGTGGLRQFIRQSAPMIDTIRQNVPAGKPQQMAVAAWINQNFAQAIPDTFTTTVKGQKTVVNGRHDRLAKWLLKHDNEELTKGIFTDPFSAFQRRVGRGYDVAQTGEAILDTLADRATMRQAASKSTAAPVPAKQLLKELGFSTSGKDANNAISKLAERMGLAQASKKDLRRIGRMAIPGELADDLRRTMKVFSGPEPAGKIAKTIRSLTNLFKGSVTGDWPAFHLRNLASGTVRNYAGGAVDRRAIFDTDRLLKGKVIPKASEIPVVRAALEERGFIPAGAVVGPNRDRVLKQARGVFGKSADPTIALMDAHANLWARSTGKTADEWFERISEIKKGDRSQLGPNALEQIVYHGTPHSWSPEPGFPYGRPRLDKIGSGEGAQAYGWGWYSAESEGTARWYQESLAKTSVEDFDEFWKPGEIRPWRGGYERVDRIEEGLYGQRGARTTPVYKGPSGWIVDNKYPDGNWRFDIPSDEEFELAVGRKPRRAANLFKLDIPDDVMPRFLDYDKPLSGQSQFVKDAIAKMDDSLFPTRGYTRESLADDPELWSVIDNYLPSGGAENLAFMRRWSKANPSGTMQDLLAALADVHQWGRSDLHDLTQMIVEDSATELTGFDVIESLTKVMGSKRASEYLREHGIVGNRYLDATSRAAGQGNHNYVLWDQPTLDRVAMIEKNGKALGLPENVLQQPARGAVEFGANGKAVITAFKAADQSTFVHETAHIFRRSLGEVSPEILRDAEAAIGVTGGRWTRANEEAFAEGFERYLADGTAPSKPLQSIFESFKEWIVNIYRSIVGTPLAKNISPELKKVFDNMLGGSKIATDEEATKILGELAYAHNLHGRNAGQNIADMQDGYLDDAASVLNSIPGEAPMTPFRDFAKGWSFAPDGSSTLRERINPLNRRGVSDRTETKFAPGRGGESLGAYTEGINRISPFLYLLRKGVDPAEAARRVKELQVDYSSRAFSPFENQIATQAAPFWKFASRQVPYMVNELLQHPGGTTAQGIRAANIASDDSATTPPHIAQSAAIPLGILPDGSKRYLSSFGLMGEAPLAYGTLLSGQVGDPLRELLGQASPLVKAPIELATGRSLFQADRDLIDQDPLLGRIGANVTGQERPYRLPSGIEYVVANSPLSRVLSTIRTATDPRKNPLVKAFNLTTGLRFSDASPAAQDAVLKNALEDQIRQEGGRLFEGVYFPEDYTPTPEQDAMLTLLNELRKRSRGRRAAKKDAG